MNDKVTIKMDTSLNEFNLMNEVLGIYNIVEDFHEYSLDSDNIIKWRNKHLYVPNLKYLTFEEYKADIFDELLKYVNTVAIHHENGDTIDSLTSEELDELDEKRQFLEYKLINLCKYYTNIENNIDVCNNRYLLFAIFTRIALDELCYK